MHARLLLMTGSCLSGSGPGGATIRRVNERLVSTTERSAANDGFVGGCRPDLVTHISPQERLLQSEAADQSFRSGQQSALKSVVKRRRS